MPYENILAKIQQTRNKQNKYNSSIHEKILQDISTNKYRAESSPSGAIIKCNLFVNDMMKKYYGIDLPKRKEFRDKGGRENVASGSASYKGWPDKPASASSQKWFFRNASEIPNTGVEKVDAETARKMANNKELVLAFGGGHATIVSPHDKWPEVYRSDLAFRGEDKRMTVGVKPGGSLEFFRIDIGKYKRFKQIMSKFKAEDIDLFEDPKNKEEIMKRLRES